MHIGLVGINHSTAPVAIRERVAITSEHLHDSLMLLRRYLPCSVILSTCNRTEIYATGSEGASAEQASHHFLSAYLDMPDADWGQYLYTYRGAAAVEHLFRVASGLDSMVIGEFEILGQVKQALESAEKLGMVNLPLRHVFRSAIRTGRRVRDETGISKKALSVSSVAVDLAAGIVNNLEDSQMLVLGAGDTGRLVARAARERGVSRILIASRTMERASALAKAIGAEPTSFNGSPQELGNCDIIVTCAGAPHRLLTYQRVEAVMKTRPQSPLVIIDIAVPRNVEPAAGQIANVFLYNIDDLTETTERNRQQRESEIQAAEDIIDSEMTKFVSWWQTLEVRPVVTALMKKAEGIRQRQLHSTLDKLRSLSQEEREGLEAMTRSIVTRILKEPISALKAGPNGDRDYARIVSELFQLDVEKKQ
ncbi:MAG: glutamyl-tRNA reductase [Chloroflexi bacterium]|nr:glutamyl-tRNA reductase [Chloroflexota bacterium]